LTAKAGKQTIAFLRGRIYIPLQASRINISMNRIPTMTARNTQVLAVFVALTIEVFGIASASAQDRPAEKSPLFKIDRWTTCLAFAPDGQ